MAEWFENFFDGIYAKVLPKVFTEEQTLHHVRIVKRLLRLRKSHRVLDIPCGMGRLTIPLAKMGIQMTGVDLTASYIRRARRDAKKEGLAIHFVQSDMRNIDFDSEFHAAFNWFGSFGYFSDADNLEFCKRVFRALRPGGNFLAEGINRSWIVSHFRPVGRQIIGSIKVTERSRLRGRASRVETTWTLSSGRKTETHTSNMRIFNAADIRALLRAAGFRDIKLFGDHRFADIKPSANPPLSRLTRHHRRIIAIATKSRTKGGNK